MQQEENADENFKTHRIIVNNFPIFLIDASFSSIICSKKKKILKEIESDHSKWLETEK